MSTQLSKEKLNIIRRTLVQNKFSAKIKEIENALGKMIFEKRMNAVPKHILTAWESTPEKERTQYFHTSSSTYISRYAQNLLKKTKAKFPEYPFTGNYFSDGMNINCPPYISSNSGGITESELCNMMDDDSEFADKLMQFFKYHEEKYLLNKKLECLFSSKRFYPNTLKNDFPEAYQVWMKISYPEIEATPTSNGCDAVENVRAMLNSNK